MGYFSMVKIVADKHEKKIISMLEKLGAEVVEQVLEIDYYIPDSSGSGVAIERKEVVDLANSIISGRLWWQLRNLCNYPADRHYMIIEGDVWRIKRHSKFSLDALYLALLSIAHSWKLQLLWTPYAWMTAKILYKLAEKVQVKGTTAVPPLRSKPKGLEDKEYARLVLEGFPGISSARAIEILERYGSLESAIENIEYWDEIKGIGRQTVEKILRVFRARF